MNVANKSELKEKERANWASVAAGWRRRDELLRKGSAPVTERMLDLAGLGPGQRVLDIASGTGEPAISAAQRVGPAGRVVGTDLVEEMLAHARDKAAAAGLDNIEFRCVDGEALEFEAGHFDAVTCRWGLMFMPEPGACLEGVHRVLKPGGRVVLACWAEPERTPFVSLPMRILGNYMELPSPPPGAPGIFAFADPDRLRGVLEQSGFGDIGIEAMEIDVMEVDDGAAYWAALEDLAAPVMALVNTLEQDARAAFVDELVRTADGFKQGERLRMPGTTWIAWARR